MRTSKDTTYRTFLRSARNFEEFSRARKRTVDRGLTYSEASRACERYNAERTAREINHSTKLEFEREDLTMHSIPCAKCGNPVERLTILAAVGDLVDSLDAGDPPSWTADDLAARYSDTTGRRVLDAAEDADEFQSAAAAFWLGDVRERWSRKEE